MGEVLTALRRPERHPVLSVGIPEAVSGACDTEVRDADHTLLWFGDGRSLGRLSASIQLYCRNPTMQKDFTGTPSQVSPSRYRAPRQARRAGTIRAFDLQ